MGSISNGRLTGLAVVVSGALVAGGAVLLSGPASAQSDPLAYSCTVTTSPNVGTFVYDLSVVWDTDAPSTVVDGGPTVDTVKSTGSVTVDPDAIDQLQTLGADHVSGSATVPMTVNGGDWTRSMTVTSGLVPPIDGVPMVVTLESAADGILPSGGPGNQIPIGSGSSFSAALVARNASNSQVGPTLGFSCALNPPEQNQAVDVVGVLQQTSGPSSPTGPTGPTGPTEPTDTSSSSATATATSTATSTPTPKSATTTTATATYRAATDRLLAKGKVVAAVGDVTGSVKLVLKRNGVRLKTATVEVNERGVAKKVFRNITKPGRYTVVARYLGSPTLARSSDTDKVTV